MVQQIGYDLGVSNKPFILIAEDDPDDFILLQQAFAEIKIPVDMLRLDNGLLVLQHLDTIADQAKLPRLIILDMNLPKLRGLETIRLLKANEKYNNIPVVIHTSVINEDEKEKCLQIGAAAFFQKPIQFENLLSQVRFFISLCFGKTFIPKFKNIGNN